MIREGARVMIADGSEANGDRGTVWRVQENGIVLVQLDGKDEAIWPCHESDLDVLIP